MDDGPNRAAMDLIRQWQREDADIPADVSRQRMDAIQAEFARDDRAADAELARLRAIEAAARRVVAPGVEWWADEWGCTWCRAPWPTTCDEHAQPTHAPDCAAMALDAALAEPPA